MKGIQQIHKKCTHGEVDITIDFGSTSLGFDNPHKKIINFAPMVKWISQSTSDRFSRVRILLGAP